MNKVEQEFEELERELQALAPRTPSPDLKIRIAEDLTPAKKRTTPIWIGLAAALLLGLGLFSYFNPSADEPEVAAAIDWQPIAEEPPAKPFKPVLTTQRLVVNESDEGVFHMEGIGPVRKIRYQTLTRSAWPHPETGEPISVTTPDEQVVFVRLNNQL